MKKLVLGLTVCWCVTANGMNEYFKALEHDPQDKDQLSKLVDLCVQKTGERDARLALNMFKEAKTRTKNVSWERIGAMLYAIVYDWDRAGYYGVGDCLYYVNGVYTGRFGPFTSGDFKDEPYFSTSYKNEVFPVPDHIDLD